MLSFLKENENVEFIIMLTNNLLAHSSRTKASFRLTIKHWFI